jgi:2-iminobutanoate/2-iminopropanoate deaminase
MAFEPISGPGLPGNKLPFSSATRAGGFVFVSGQASVDDAGNLALDTFENEMRRTMKNVERVLAAAGLGLKDVVRVGAYLIDPQYWDEYNRLYREYFKEPYPARTTIVKCLGQVKVEIDVVAYGGENAGGAS